MLALLLLGLYCSTNALAPNNNRKPPPTTASRRQAMAALLGAAAVALIRPKDANAACIAGDTSVNCIGAYKEDIPGQRGTKDIYMNNYLFRLDRDDTVIKTPGTLDEAIGMLSDQKLAMDQMEKMVSSGKLEDAGVLLLASLPKLTVAGRFVVYAVPAAARIQPIFEQVQEAVKVLDKTIAMGIRGHNGALTVAQLAVLKDLATAKSSLDDFIKLANVGKSLA